MNNSRVKYKKILDAALLVLSFLFLCAGPFISEGFFLCVMIVVIYICTVMTLMFLVSSYKKFNDWVNKGDNNG